MSGGASSRGQRFRLKEKPEVPLYDQYHTFCADLCGIMPVA